MKKASIRGLFLFVAAMAILALLTAGTRPSEAASCDPMEMRACLPAFKSSEPPTSQCCEKAKKQEPCFCEYLKSPVLRPYLESPNAKKIAESCGVPIPTC